MHQYKVFILLIQVFLFAQISSGSFERTAQPTALFGRAMSGSALFNSGNMWLNPASIAKNTSFFTSVFYSPSPFQLEQLSNFGLNAVKDFDGVNIGAGFSSFGFSLYRETVISFSAATIVTEFFAVGMNIHANHLSIQSYGSASTAVVDLGVIFSATENLTIGISLNNVSRSTFGADDDIPQTFVTGLSYAVLEKTAIVLDIVHDVRYTTGYRAGIEFSPHEIVTIRAGTQSEQSKLFGGIGINVFSFQIDYGIATHSELGPTHSIGITFAN
ncbi:MAG: hypothetical protein Q8L88_14470 [Bacteroidota bacterium]|nr:hypothetical protein [Bacteroidota bacterium]